MTQVGNRAQPVSDAAFTANGVTPFEVDVDAVVAWDGAGLDVDETPRVATMAQSADYFFTPEPSPTEAPDPEADTGTYRRFVEAGVDAMQVPMHCTLAWMDRYVKADDEGLTGQVRRAARRVAEDATRRLVATTFDGSADASAIGAGTFDPATGRNVPHTIEGEAVADHLSIYHRSAYAFDGHRCDDMGQAC